MTQDYESEIIYVLKEIKDIIKKQEVPWDTGNKNSSAVKDLRDQIFYALEERTTWGRNQIKALITNIIENGGEQNEKT